MFAHILAQRVRFFERYGSDDLNMRVNMGASAFGSILNQAVLGGARDAATVVSLLAVMVIQDAMLTAICLLAVPVVFLAITRLLKRIKALMEQEMLSVVELNRHVREVGQGIKVIKAYNLEPIIPPRWTPSSKASRTVPTGLRRSRWLPCRSWTQSAAWASASSSFMPDTAPSMAVTTRATFLSFITALLLLLDLARR